MLVWFCLFSLPHGVWEGLRFVTVVLPGLFSYLLLLRTLLQDILTNYIAFPFKGNIFNIHSLTPSITEFIQGSNFSLHLLKSILEGNRYFGLLEIIFRILESGIIFNS